MKNNILLYGSKSTALLISKVFKNYNKELNLRFFNIKGSKKRKLKIKYIFDPFNKKANFKTKAIFSNKPNDLKKFIFDSNFFINCIGLNHGKARYLVSRELEKFNLKPLNVVNISAFIDSSAKLGKGVIVMPNSTVHSYSKIGDYCILNTSSIIDHECSIGKGTHIMGGSYIAGKVTIGNFVTIGANSTILQNLKIADGAYIGAGSVVTKNVRKNEVVVGNPAKFLRYNIHNYDLKVFKNLSKTKKKTKKFKK